ncbi:hypothetical protein [Streptomyces meridianus]|uniref:Integral membrane protein n=1 Tax=Streptomyces meridianus TaxID=2938945 RepID=A0ABT0X1P5_9ACTN|nr:hypothetical protein [Streptomyces meridianus]MCM2576080.1 hypothetical protein [Streptomyces meridianus]
MNTAASESPVGSREPAGPGHPGDAGRKISLTGTVLRTEIRRGVAPWTFAVCLTALLIAVFGGRYSLMDWPGTAQASRGLLVVLGPLLAGAACWQAGRERRRRTRELVDSAPRSALRRVVCALLPVWLAAVAAHLVTWVVLVALTWPSASAYGHPLVAPMAADLTAAAAFAAGGHLLGWYLPSSWALTPGTAVGAYGVLWLGEARGRSALGQLSPASFELHNGQLLVWWASVAHMAWFGGLAAAMLLIVTARRTWLVALPLAVAVAGAVPLLAWPEKMWLPDRSASALVCEGERPVICLRQAHASRRDTVEGPIRWAYGLFEGAPTAPVRFEEGRLAAGRTWGADLEPGSDPAISHFTLVNPGDLGSDKRLGYFQRDAVLQDLITWECERNVPSWAHEVLFWAHGQWPGDMEEQWRDGPVVKALEAMTAKERRAWFTDYFAAARTCDRERVDRP